MVNLEDEQTSAGAARTQMIETTKYFQHFKILFRFQ